MAQSKTFSGQLPLMRVSQQQPHSDRDARLDSTTFRLQLHTFVDKRSYSPSSTPLSSATTANLSASTPSLTHNVRLPAVLPAYKRIAFTTAQIPGLPATGDTGDSSKGPKRKRRRIAQNGKTRLKTFRPVSSSADIHADAWSIILSHTRPGFLMQMRTVSKFFYHITNTDTIWRCAREHHFGADMPPRPPLLTERQYACLLDGRGCQNPRCERRETRKVRWVFRLRLCDECLSRNLEIYKNDHVTSPQSRYASMFQNTADREQYGTSFIDLLPTSGTWSGKPNAPRTVNRDTGKWSSRSASASPLLYLKRDYAAVEAEYKQIVEEDWSPERVFEWVKEKYCKAILIARTAAELESWEFGRLSVNMGIRSTRLLRKNYFVRKALQLSPPMSEDVLLCFAAYHASLGSSNPPSKRSWEALLAKILPYRHLAEEVVQFWSARYGRFGRPNFSSSEISWFDQLHEHRKTRRKELGKWSPEQQFVLDIAEEEFSKLVDQVADEDLLLMCLRNVYDAYQASPSKPDGLNFDRSFGEYRLSLDDAKLVVEEVLEKHIKKPTLRGVRVLESLKCMGCTRFVSGRRYSFQSAFEHMQDKHSRLVGKDLHFHRFLKYSKVPPECLSKDYRFPWYLVEWTRSLPILPTHAKVTSETRWIPDEATPYIPLSTSSSMSAFDGRRAVRPDVVTLDDFPTYFVHAAETLSTTRLDSECIVKTAIRYGSDLVAPHKPSIDEFFECIKSLQDFGSGLHFKFRCGVCNRRPDVNSHLRCVKHSVEIGVLRKHWDDKHAHEKLDWTSNFMDLPSDTALWEIMLEQDHSLQQDQANSIARETVGLKMNARKLADQKAGALMQKEMAVDAFSRLFAVSD